MSAWLWAFGISGATIVVLYAVAVAFALWTVNIDSRCPPSRGEIRTSADQSAYFVPAAPAPRRAHLRVVAHEPRQ